MKQSIRILHLEDSPRDAEIIADLLLTSGVVCTITHVPGRDDFLAALEREPFDLIICDYNLPGHDGISGLRQAREKQPGVPVLMVSGSIGDEEAVRCLHAGATDYILKERLHRLGPAIKRALEEVETYRGREIAETALRESERRFTRLAEQSDDVFWFTGLNPERLLYVSPAVKQVWCIPLEKCLEDARFWINAVHPNDRERVDAAFAAFQTGQTSHFEEKFRVVRPDGSERQVLNRATMMHDEVGRAVGISGIARDVTEMCELEDQFRQAQKMEAVGRLAGGIAHDFNNALTVIIGCTELAIQQLGQGHPCQGDLNEIRKAAESAARLTRQLLTFSRKQILQPVVLDINATIEESQPMLRRLVGEDVELTVRLGTHVGQIKADRGQLDQVLMNLAVNARDAMPDGDLLTIETSSVRPNATEPLLSQDLAPGPYVRLAVSDTGHGMTPEVQTRLFEPFFTTKGPGKGTGLGLATVYGIVKQSRGSIRVLSQPGRGTTFYLYLPEVEGDKQTARTARPEKSKASATGGETILLVEDQEGLLALAARTLERGGYRVLRARKPSEACTIAGQHPGPLHLLLTDVVMPEMNGRALAQALTQTHPDLRVLYMSGYTDDIIGPQGFLEEGVVLIEKPFTTATLISTVRRTLDGSSERA